MEKLIYASIGMIMFVVVAMITYVGGDYITSTEKRETVTVLERMYEAASTSTGYGITSSGNSGVVVTSKGPEYDLLLEFKNGHREIVSTDENTLINVDVGESIILTCTYGGWSESLLSCEM